MHGAEHVVSARREDARDLCDHAGGVGHEDERVVVVHEVECPVGEAREIPHVALHEAQARAAFASERADRRELALREIEEGRLGPELGEQDGIPAAAARE